MSKARLSPLFVRISIGALVMVLLVVLALLLAYRPRVDGAFHAEYLSNLRNMGALTGTLHRDHLLVRQGLVRHFDYLEADLEMMERTAELAQFNPDFVDEDFLSLRLELLTQYQSSLADLRVQVEKSKGSIALLWNAHGAFRQLLGELNAAQSERMDDDVRTLLNELNYSLVYEELKPAWLEILASLARLRPALQRLTRPLSLHARMILVQQEELGKASERMYGLLDRLVQPASLKNAYLDQYHSIITFTNRLLWLSYAVVAALLALCVALMLRSRKARAIALHHAMEAELASKASERRVLETQQSVKRCNELLAKIGNGEFSHRLEGRFDEELELLRVSINQTADSVEFTIHELSRVMLAIQQGRFDVRLSDQVRGAFGQQVDETICSLDAAIGDICQVMDKMREGCFKARVEADCQGRLDDLKVSINETMQVLEEAISDVVVMVQYQAQGDFSRSIQVKGKGQIALLGNSINETSSRVHEMVEQIREVSQTVACTSDSMLSDSRLLWKHTTFYADAIATLLDKVDLVRQSIQTNCKSVEQASALASRSQLEAESGTEIANQAVRYMESITEKSQQVTRITEFLDKIASQTKLLALNAAVEAAHAGEYGSGFSVVTNEVKELARQSARASTNITALIQEAKQDMEVGSESVRNTGRALALIGESIINVEVASRAIVEESLQQEKGMDSIMEVACQARQVVAADVSLAEKTRETSESLGELAYRVSELLAFFNPVDGEITANDQIGVASDKQMAPQDDGKKAA